MKVSFYTHNDPQPGQFVQTLDGDFNLIVIPTAQELGLPYIEGEYGEDHWFHDGQVKPRPASPVTLNGMTLHNVPDGSTVTINEVDYEATGPDLVLDLAGSIEYQITVSCWPYLDWKITIPGE